MPDLFKQVLEGNYTASAGDAGEYSGVSEPILRSLVTGKPALSTPRTGFGALLAKTGLVSPQQQVDQRTYDIEQLAIEKKRQMNQMVKMAAIGQFANMVKLVGGDPAIKMAPDFFGDLLQDKDVVNAFAGIKGYSDLREQALQNQLDIAGFKHDIDQARMDILRQNADTARDRANTYAWMADIRASNPATAAKDPLLTSIYNKLAADFTIPSEIKTQVYAAIAAGASGRQVAGILAEATKPKPAEPSAIGRIYNWAYRNFVGTPAAPAASGGGALPRYPESAPPPAGMSPGTKGKMGTPAATPTLPW